MKPFRKYISIFFKGMGMGAANVIPGVSGGTIAMITGIFEELIDSIKSFDLVALKLLITGKFKQFAAHVNLSFLISVFLGISLSIVSLAKLLEFLFNNYPVYIWSYFFGLILASVYFIGRTIDKWNAGVILFFVIGTVVAIGISLMNPATENQHFFYLIICGIVAICSMILPGLSGSFVLILMGNYELVVINAVTNVRLDILFPVIIGAAIGLIAFSHFLSWVYKKYRNLTISILTGFILGSLSIIWPWKEAIYKLDTMGVPVKKSSGELVIQGWERYIPDHLSQQVVLAVIFVVVGAVTIWAIEKLAQEKQN
jgi:putative membrane protein